MRNLYIIINFPRDYHTSSLTTQASGFPVSIVNYYTRPVKRKDITGDCSPSRYLT